MNAEFSIVDLVLQASPVVKAILVVLAIASIASWAVIIEKARALKEVRKSANEFEANFWSGVDLNNLYREVSQSERTPLGMAGIFEAGFREFGRLKKESDLTSEQLVAGARRAMSVSQMRDLDRLEDRLALLATVGSTSPYVGLFGTVWGIMGAFQSLGGVQSATISMVAPGIVEALVATAMGLFAAIPAMVSYNRFAAGIDRMSVRFDTFVEELTAIFQRSATRRDAQAGIA